MTILSARQSPRVAVVAHASPRYSFGGGEIAAQRECELLREYGLDVLLAGAIVRQCQQTDHGATGIARRLRGNQPVPGMTVCITREQLIAVDQMQQRHWLATQGMDDVTIINHMAASAAIGPALWNAPAG